MLVWLQFDISLVFEQCCIALLAVDDDILHVMPSNLALVARKNRVNLLRRHPTVGRTVVRMHSGIARQQCVCVKTNMAEFVVFVYCS